MTASWPALVFAAAFLSAVLVPLRYARRLNEAREMGAAWARRDGGSALLTMPLRLSCLVPAAWFALFALIVLRARIALGYWPHPQRGNPFEGTFERSPLDPDTFPIHWLVLSFTWPVAMLFVLACPVVLGRIVVQGWRGPSTRFALAYALGCALCGTVWLADPRGAWDWFLD